MEHPPFPFHIASFGPLSSEGNTEQKTTETTENYQTLYRRAPRCTHLLSLLHRFLSDATLQHEEQVHQSLRDIKKGHLL